MKVAVAGGGPAGLYFALLMARGGEHQVTVWERNPADATYGWGVVFSEGTLAELREVDYLTFVELDQALVRWSAIDIRHRSTLRSYGHGFSAISRRTLLSVLQRRAREMGVDLRFEAEVGPELLEAGYDLVVAADGVNSQLRTHHEGHFRPQIRRHPTRYIWLGVPFAFPAFTFIFAETPAGLFQVHAYPYSAANSTFIVECTEATWKRAGLEEAEEEENIAFCEKVFADHLQGAPLLSNRSTWINFPTLRCRTWHRGNLVLIGDACHTAHFSIGSGTKLAMEDSAALHQALSEHPADLEAALASYEASRQPPVARFQEAAVDSSRYFENVARYLHLPEETFAFNLLTRSGRVTHLDLERLDPSLTVAADRRVAGAPGGEAVARPSLTGFDLAGLALPNRLVSSDPDSGAGLVFAPAVAVSPEGRSEPSTPGLWDSGEGWQQWTEAVRAGGSQTGLVLSHAGRRASCRPPDRGIDRPLRAGGWETVAASPLAYTPRHPTPRPLTPEDGDRLVGAYVDGAKWAAAAGFQVLMVDAARGNLLAGFLSPLTNHRTDGWGGDLAGRLRFPLLVVTAVREQWRGPLAVRITASDWHPGGIATAEVVGIAQALAAAGVDLIEVTGGGTVPSGDPPYRRRYLLPLADEVRFGCGLPVLVGGGLQSLDEIDTALAAGRVDLCRLDPALYRRPLRR